MRRLHTGSRAALLTAVIVAAGLVTGCGGKRQEAAGRPAFSLFYTCDTQGHLYPCDCETGKEGGIARRLTYLVMNPAPDRILVDAGNMTAGNREWERLELEYLLKACAVMEYDAVNLGHAEASLDLEQLRNLGMHFPTLVSANLVDAGGECVVSPYVVVPLSNGHRVGILGVMDDTISPGDLGGGLQVVPPDAAIGRHLPGLVEKSDTVILLAFADRNTMIELANLFFEIPYIIGGRVEQPSGTPLRVNDSVIAFITDKGKTIGRLDLAAEGEEQRVHGNSITELTDYFPDDPRAVPILAGYENALSNRQFRAGRALTDDREGLSLIDARTKTGGETE